MSTVIVQFVGVGTNGKPIISNYVPSEGTPIQKNTHIQFDVIDDSGVFRRIMVVVEFRAKGDYEVIHDGNGFAPNYRGYSSRVAIANGFRYNILRRGGWSSTPTINVSAIDELGEEGEDS